MFNSKVIGVGHYVPNHIVTNKDLEKIMDTTDEWIQERTGIQERRWIKEGSGESTTSMAFEAAKKAIANAGISKDEIDFIVFASLSPDYYFPGGGVKLQALLELETIGALDVRNQCSGFIYSLSVADQFIKTGMYKNVLVVGSEHHSGLIDKSTKGRSVSVIFGDGAAAMVLQATTDENVGVLTTALKSEGKYADELMLKSPSPNHWLYDILQEEGNTEDDSYRPYMNGNFVFKHAVTRMPQVLNEVLASKGFTTSDIDLLVPHQANLRINQYVQKQLKLNDDKVFNNIMKYGNTSAASIPLAISEAVEQGKIKSGDLVATAAFGSGFTWASALIRF